MCWPVCPAAPVTRTRRGVSVASAEAELHAVSRKIIEEVVIFIVQVKVIQLIDTNVVMVSRAPLSSFPSKKRSCKKIPAEHVPR